MRDGRRVADERRAVDDDGDVVDEQPVGLLLVTRQLDDVQPYPAQRVHQLFVLAARPVDIDALARQDIVR